MYENASLESGREQFNNLWNGMYCYRTKISFEGLFGIEENCLSKERNFFALLIEFQIFLLARGFLFRSVNEKKATVEFECQKTTTIVTRK